MATVHNLLEYALGGLRGMQSSQRDWSPYLVHLTSWGAMLPVRSAITSTIPVSELRAMVELADQGGMEVVRLVAASGRLRASPAHAEADKFDRVCLTECTLVGLLGHSERFGRFGWVFSKEDIYAAGGRPCSYLDDESYGSLAAVARASAPDSPLRTLWSLSNVYRPPGSGQIQDFTHEREWRVFNDIVLADIKPVAIVAPTPFVDEVMGLFPSVKLCVPLDVLHRWGA